MLQLRGRCFVAAQIILLTFLLGTIVLVGGTAAEPIEVSDVEDLQNVSEDLEADYVLVDDVDLSDVEFDRIGSEDMSFSGSFDGDNYTVSNLSLTAEDDALGLFATTSENASISNLVLEDVDVEGARFASPAGALVGRNSGDLENIRVDGRVRGHRRTGGIVGHNMGGTLRALRFYGEVEGGVDVGGVVADTFRGVVQNSSSTGTVMGEDRTGGLAGTLTLTKIKSSYSEADVSGANVTGGLIGSNSAGDIVDSYSTGDVSGVSWTGGLVGIHGNGSIERSHATGDVEGEANVGGLVGGNIGIISRSHFSGSVSGQRHVGSLVGSQGMAEMYDNTTAKLEHSYWDIEAPDRPTVGVIYRGKGNVILNNVTPPVERDETEDEEIEPNEMNETPEEEGLPGFGVTSALAAILLATGFAREWKRTGKQ